MRGKKKSDISRPDPISISIKLVLVASENNDEHEGFCHICRGIMLAFRNPTHHYLSDSFSREDALKFTVFVDNLLKIVDKCKIISST